MTKGQWKVVWRLIRVGRRESAKATMDTMLYGIGCTYVGHDGILHVPAAEMLTVFEAE